MKKSFFLLHLSIVLAGFTGIFGKLITLNEGLLVWYRVCISAILLLVILKFTGGFRRYSRRHALRIMISGMLPALHWVFFYGSIKYANVSVGVVCFCLTSFFSALLNPLINDQKLSVTELLLSTLTMAGVAMIFHFDSSYRTGIILGVISSLFAALYTMTNEKLVKKYSTRMINYYQMLGGTIGLAILLPLYISFFKVQQLFPTVNDMFYLMMLSLFCTIGLYLMVAEVLKTIPSFTVNLSFNLEPIYSILLAMLIFSENRDFTTAFYIGLSMIVISVVLQMAIFRIKRRRQISDNLLLPVK